MSRSSADLLLCLEAGAWTLGTGPDVRRIAFGGATPAPALEALDAAATPPRSRLQIVIDDSWLRYLVVRWPDALRGREERQAYLAHRFREVHGVAEPEWTFAFDRGPVHFPVLACAAQRSVINALQAFARARRLRLVGVAGCFVHRFNRLQRRLDSAPGDFGALAVARGSRLTVGLWRDGAWQALRSQNVGDHGPQILRQTLESWTLRMAGADRGGVLYASGIAPAAPTGWRIEDAGDASWP
ncbi:hypothetical protein [Aromatoleum aromaticum]|uniref:Uncharacterized protein n=1 Tax=Aromatoleum aromaticum (strain DSM 19018 / LMG 30748 / EbN1) TaxID=76114 RepID=Q5P7D4_AROAE|nr:hypothetical protein [Aromatoleum aromaticum]NMG53686.1 hypothetical protein [Aromatoleum aromaticum]CAI06777.1 hypothetical protein ebD34 [Aromatoleum aromaticum EbN1]